MLKLRHASLEIACVLLLTSLFFSCNTPSTGTPYFIAESKINFHNVPLDRSRVFVYFGPHKSHLEALTIKVDDQKMGMIGPNSFIFFDIPKGTHSLDAYWAYSVIRSKLIFDTTQDEELYIQTIWNPGPLGGNLIINVKPSSIGKDDIKGMQYINGNN